MIGFDFAGLDLQAQGITVTETNAFGAPEKESKIIDLARRHGSVKVYERLKDRRITLGGAVNLGTQDDLVNAMDILKGFLLFGTGNLNVTDGTRLRRWIADCENMNISRDENMVTRAIWSAEFYSGNPFAVDGVTDTLIDTTITTTSYNGFMQINGSYLGYPIIQLTVTSVSPGTAIDITIQNPVTSQALTISHAFVGGEIITIDTFNETVFIDSLQINPSGQFPVWLPGGGSLQYSDTAASRSVHMLVTNDRRYL